MLGVDLVNSTYLNNKRLVLESARHDDGFDMGFPFSQEFFGSQLSCTYEG